MMTIAGPATSILAAIVFAIIWIIGISLHVQTIEIIAGLVAVLNLTVGIFNLVPAYPLDGGRIFRALIWMKTKDIVSATKVASYLSYVLSYLLMALGVLEFFVGAFVNGIWAILLGLFLHQLTRIGYQQVLDQQYLGGVKVADIMDEDFLSIPASTTVSDYVNHYLFKRHSYDCIVMQNEQAIGILEADRAMAKADRNTQVSAVMIKLTQKLHLGLQDTALKAMHLMEQNRIHILPVFDNRQLVGAVSLVRIGEYLRLRQEISAKKLLSGAEGGET